jgi:putative oxidoreductase
MKIALAQILLAFAFLASGCMKLFAFDKMAAMMPGIADLHGLFAFIGLCEIAGAIGLVAPILMKIYPVLTAWAAAGLATIMFLAAGFHLYRGEASHLPPVVILFLLAAFVVWGRGFRKTA